MWFFILIIDKLATFVYYNNIRSSVVMFKNFKSNENGGAAYVPERDFFSFR